MFTPSKRKDSACHQSCSERMAMNISLRFPWLVCSPEAKCALPGTFILRLMTTFCQSNLTGPPQTRSSSISWQILSDQIRFWTNTAVLCGASWSGSRLFVFIYLFFNRREKQHIRTPWRWRVWSSAVFIDRAKHCLFSSNPTVDHEVFIPRLPVMKAVLCIM